MPLYEYNCGKCGIFEVFYKSLPSEDKQAAATCPDCDSQGKRILSEFRVNGTQNGSMEKVASFATASKDVGGRLRPVYTDQNGQTREIKTARDIDSWTTHNQLGPPRMIEWTNPKTGLKSMVPQRVRMVADPLSGEPLDGPVVRESERLVPLDATEFAPPRESRTGIPIDAATGISRMKSPAEIALRSHHGKRIIDPETGRPMTLADCWGGGS